ncbi:MAG TPA: sigma-70 family RNA polymerase sigma factor [Tepidisphaeraceae bacterium]|nr:sigma-70 family RNA polymerase sigma factor [Tepidisphaeraceae bacterium]
MPMERIEQLRQQVLVLKCQTGDRLAWEELYRQYNPSLGYYLRRLMGNDALAEDVQQEVWLTVVRNIGGLKSPEAFTVWLYRIARTRAIDRVQSKAWHAELIEEAVEHVDASDDDAFSPADAARVHAGLATLAAAHREVLLLRFMEDLSYEEIAQVIGSSVGTVRSRIHYAKGALRRQLEKDHE